MRLEWAPMTISLTESAANRVKTFLSSRGHGAGLRLGVRKTGCSGFAYVINYADEANPGDVMFEDRGVKVFVDPGSLGHALGPDALDELERATGMKRDEVLTHLSHELPDAVDHVTPEGRLPVEDELARQFSQPR